MLGADTRSTAGTTVADKNCEKIHYIGARCPTAGHGMMHNERAVSRLEGAGVWP